MSVIKIKPLDIFAYKKDGTKTKWLIPVCSSSLRRRLDELSPNHPGNWEEVDIGGCPTICYRISTGDIKKWNELRLKSVWPQFADRIGIGPAREFFNCLFVRYNNIKAMNRNRWEQSHGGIRACRFDRGMSVRKAASMSIV